MQAIQQQSEVILNSRRPTLLLSLPMRTETWHKCSLSYSLCVAGKQKEGLGGLGYNGMTSARADEINANKMLNY